MTNKEKYKQAFSVLRASDDFYLEVNKMKHKTRHFRFTRAAAIVAACVMVMGSATIAYAADVGGIQRIIQLWIRGEQTMVSFEVTGDGTYSMEYTDEAGNVKHQGGGGVAIADDGTEIPLSEEELLAELMSPEVVYEDDGSVLIYWFDQTIDITDEFEDGICYVKLVNGEETLYMTVKYENGYATSPHRYLTPGEFNTTIPE